MGREFFEAAFRVWQGDVFQLQPVLGQPAAGVVRTLLQRIAQENVFLWCCLPSLPTSHA
jgi:hypothetical protein